MLAVPIELPTLYRHQEEQRDRVREALTRHRAVILAAAPGQGKTRMSKWILAKSVINGGGDRKSGNMLFTVHRRGLVDNAVKSFQEDPFLPHGVIMSGRSVAYHYPVQVASIDTLLSWWIEDGTYATNHTFDLIVIDECHSHHNKYMSFLRLHNRKRKELGLHPPFVIGLTATPQAKGLADLYGSIVFGPSTHWLIEHGFLSPFKYYAGVVGRLGELRRSSTGEFTNKSVDVAMKGLAGSMVRDWRRFADGRPTIGFFPRLSHALEARSLLLNAGIRAEYLDGNTPDDERHRMFDMLSGGYLDYICNVGVIERGTDLPCVSCIQLCTAIGTVVRYRQMIGRGSRTHPNKQDCIVLDHGGNVMRHGFFEDDVEWTLDNTQATVRVPADRPPVQCPQCDAIYRGGKCRYCGYEPPKKRLRPKKLTFNGTRLQEIQKGRRRQSGSSKTPEQIMISALYAAGRSGRTFRQAVAIAYKTAAKHGVRFHVPRTVTVAGRTYTMLPKGSLDSGRYVSDLYPFTVGRH